MAIVALTGVRKSGKTQAANIFVSLGQEMGIKIKKVSFADSLRDLFSKETGVGIDTLTSNILKEEFRDRLILFGETKRKEDPYIFINNLFKSILPKENIIIDDLRLFEELDVLLKNGAAIYKIEASDLIRKQRNWSYFPEVDNHYTETELTQFPQEQYIRWGGGIIQNNTNNIEDLTMAVEPIIKRHFLPKFDML